MRQGGGVVGTTGGRRSRGGSRHHSSGGGSQGAGGGTSNQSGSVNRQQPRSGGSTRHQTFDSNGPDVRVRGSAWQVYEKYQTLARDSISAGDHVAAENYQQHAEHYYRIIEAINESLGQSPGQGLEVAQTGGQQLPASAGNSIASVENNVSNLPRNLVPDATVNRGDASQPLPLPVAKIVSISAPTTVPVDKGNLREVMVEPRPYPLTMEQPPLDSALVAHRGSSSPFFTAEEVSETALPQPQLVSNN